MIIEYVTLCIPTLVMSFVSWRLAFSFNETCSQPMRKRSITVVGHVVGGMIVGAVQLVYSLTDYKPFGDRTSQCVGFLVLWIMLSSVIGVSIALRHQIKDRGTVNGEDGYDNEKTDATGDG